MMTATRPTRQLTTRKGKTVETPYTDAEALTILRGLPSPSGFAADLCRTARTRRGLSPDQMAWVHILAVETTPPPAGPATLQVEVGDFEGVLALFAAVRGRLKFPKVRLQHPTRGIPIVLKPSPPGPHEGTVVVADDRPRTLGGRFYGRIDAAGRFNANANADGPLVELLRALAADPARVAGEQGRLLGRCCFCGLALEDERSTAVGYGPICARHWSLPWGETVTDPATGGVVERTRGRQKAATPTAGVVAEAPTPTDNHAGCDHDCGGEAEAAELLHETGDELRSVYRCENGRCVHRGGEFEGLDPQAHLSLTGHAVRCQTCDQIARWVRRAV